MNLNGPKQIAVNTAFFTVFLSLPVAGIVLQTDLQRFLELVQQNSLVAAGIAVFFLFMILFTTPGGGHTAG